MSKKEKKTKEEKNKDSKKVDKKSIKKDKEKKNKEKDENENTGSTQNQILSLNKEIKELANHLQRNIHDHSSRRGLIKKINKRRKLLKYLKVQDLDLYEKMLATVKKKKKKVNK